MKTCRFRAPAPNRSLPAAALRAGLTLLLAAATPVHAAKWISVSAGAKPATDRIEVDAGSISRSSDGKVRAWHRETYATRRLQESWAFSYSSLKQLTEFNCDKRQAAPLQRLYFGDGGSPLKSETIDAQDAATVVPDTPGERVFNHVCSDAAGVKLAVKPAPAAPAPVIAAEPVADVAKSSKARGKGDKEEAPPPPPPPPKPPAAWSYEGKLGPAKWGKLSEDYATCGKGQRQSPVDIRSPIRADLPPIRFTWQPVVLNLVDTGHTIQVNTDGGGQIVVEGEEYKLQNFRFRLPGEEMVNGRRAAMSVQFEHRSESGRVAIVAVPLVAGKENRLVRTLWTALPLERGKVRSVPGIKIDPGQLLPLKRDYSTYVGSLTTPPCDEGVLWLVLKQPVSVSKEQIADFAKIYRNNVRPVQAANGRVLKESR